MGRVAVWARPPCSRSLFEDGHAPVTKCEGDPGPERLLLEAVGDALWRYLNGTLDIQQPP
jgi:hypothetical protein